MGFSVNSRSRPSWLRNAAETMNNSKTYLDLNNMYVLPFLRSRYTLTLTHLICIHAHYLSTEHVDTSCHYASLVTSTIVILVATKWTDLWATLAHRSAIALFWKASVKWTLWNNLILIIMWTKLYCSLILFVIINYLSTN